MQRLKCSKYVDLIVADNAGELAGAVRFCRGILQGALHAVGVADDQLVIVRPVLFRQRREVDGLGQKAELPAQGKEGLYHSPLLTAGAQVILLTEQRAAPDFARRPYLYWGDSRFCKAVESEDPDRCTLFPREKLCQFSARELLAGLTDEEKAAVRRVFVSQPLPEDPAEYAEATLLLPRSFVQDGLMDQAEQDAIFKAVAAKYTQGPLFIKTHPRDDTDYTALFPEATVLDRTMPSEVLNFCLPGKFRRAVTVQSWVLRGFTAAEENIFLSLDEGKALASQSAPTE